MTRNEQILQMRAEGKSMSQIGRELGISQPRVSQLIKAYNPPAKTEVITQPINEGISPIEVLNPVPATLGGDKEGVIQTQDINSIKDKDVAVMNDLIEAREKIVKGIIDHNRSLKKERLQSLVVSAGIVIDKIRLIQGDPTAIFRHQSIIADMSDEELRRIAGIDSPHKGREGTPEPLNVSSVGEDINQAEKAPEMTSG